MIHWILIFYLYPGWQITGTGAAGATSTTATFDDKTACVAAMNTLHKANKDISAFCFPSGTEVPK